MTYHINIFYLVIVLCINYVFATPKSDSLEIQIIPVEQEYESDKIKIELKFTNNCNRTINIYNWRKFTITKAINIFLHFYIFKDDSVVLKYSYEGPSVLLPHKDDYVAIKPGEEYSEIIHLNEYYKFSKTSSNSMNIIWESGKYLVYCKYEYIHNKNFKYGKELWQGKLNSNKMEIYVK